MKNGLRKIYEKLIYFFWNKQKCHNVSVNYHESGGTDNNGYWTYTTDALVEYVSSNSNNVDFDLIIGPSTVQI